MDISEKLSADHKEKINWSIFLSSVFFVLGFSLVFSILGVLLQTVLVNSSYTAQIWLGRIGGIIIIFFGLFLLGLIKPSFLLREHKFHVKRFKSIYLTSFLFGAAFAFGWTPCVSAALGAILTLASTQPSSAFFLLMAYTFGLGIPFLILGLFTNKAQRLINKTSKWLIYVQYFFGVVLIVIGILIFTSELSKIANLPFLTNILTSLNIGTSAGGSIRGLSIFNLAIAFAAGLASFLSPCVLPLLPGFLSYLASTVSDKKENTHEIKDVKIKDKNSKLNMGSKNEQ